MTMVIDEIPGKNTILEVRDLSGGYAKGANVLRHFNLSMTKGEALGIIGAIGAGKSTLGKALMNLLPYRSGSVLFQGRDVSRLSTHELSRAGMALMHQGGAVFPGLTVQQNLDLAWGQNGNKDYRKRLEAVIPLLVKPPRERLHLQADKLSGGQRHELALVMTLAHPSAFLILDEPSAGLSPDAEESAYAILDDIRKEFGMSILLIEQNVNRARAFCDRIVEMVPVDDGNGKD